ncbi:MAG: hypothetical protein M3Q10_18985, partial [Chloroflexota bacterium]|nr:hypothetical protein [Chloroflexota bacterium]
MRRVGIMALAALLAVGVWAGASPGQLDGLVAAASGQTARAEDRPVSSSTFPLGVLEDGNRIGAPADFAAMLDDLSAHNLDSVYLVNTRATDADPFLTLADERGIGVVWAASELNESWWPESVPANLERAREVVYPLVDRMTRRAHPSLIGYHVVDEAKGARGGERAPQAPRRRAGAGQP